VVLVTALQLFLDQLFREALADYQDAKDDFHIWAGTPPEDFEAEVSE
jgi:hypothetical protein